MEIRAIAISQKDHKAIVLLRSEDGAALDQDWLQCQVVIDWSGEQSIQQIRETALARFVAFARELAGSCSPPGQVRAMQAPASDRNAA
ncbi:hypothetical protein SLNSH_04340 [Alsobacter soli]|uniref:Uncharacterized protein n=1 Tax=Alsobacter soli TaxID=2109933 RepID=A0A2T1HWH7_9HYPH|nr:hypothetical protein SLNSH_04340 [Alsobacter soli]